MKKHCVILSAFLLLVLPATSNGQEDLSKDIIETSQGDLEMTFIGHGTLMFRVGEAVIHVDPVSREADYSTLPDADLILVTHEHGDHLDPEAIAEIRGVNTVVVATEVCSERLEGAKVMKNGQSTKWNDIGIEAVPAYNIVHERSPGQAFHPKGSGNGYVLTIGDTRVFIAGDTENTPEMKALKDIDVAFLPMNLPYTMTPEMVADAATAFQPRILYPYHFGDTDPQLVVELLADQPTIDVRVRDLK